MLAPITAACIAAAATTFGVAEPALWLILKAEAGTVGACTVQTNGTHDCGPAQINAEIWVPRIATLVHRPIADVFYAVRDNGCYNINAAAYILRLKVAEAGGNVWDGLGRYNSATPALKRQYQLRLVAAYRQLYLPHLPRPRQSKKDH
jgi:hypothetical protein